MLFRIRNYIRHEKVASNQQISRALRIDFDTLEPMLAFCLRKGWIDIYAENLDCGRRCFGCKTNQIVYYQSVD